MHVGLGQLSGMGDCDPEDDFCVNPVSTGPPLPVYIATDTSGSLTQQTGGMLTPAQIAQLNNNSVVSASSPSSSGLSPSIWTTLANDVTSLANPVVKAAVSTPYYITNPLTGQSVLYNPATGQTGSAAGGSLSSVFGVGGSSSLLLLAIAAVVLFAMEGKH